MMPPLRLRELTEEEQRVIHRLANSHTVSVRLGRRAKIIAAVHQGKTIPEIAKRVNPHNRFYHPRIRGDS